MASRLKASTKDIQMILDSARETSPTFRYKNPDLDNIEVPLNHTTLAKEFFKDYKKGDNLLIGKLVKILKKIDRDSLDDLIRLLPETDSNGYLLPHTQAELHRATGLGAKKISEIWDEYLKNPSKQAHEWLPTQMDKKGKKQLEGFLEHHMRERPTEPMPIQAWAKELGVRDTTVGNYAKNWKRRKYKG